MQTALAGLYAAGEAVGGANGANRLSGNAVTEALVFGREAGLSAAKYAKNMVLADRADNIDDTMALLAADTPPRDFNTAGMLQQLQSIMQEEVGPLRTEEKLLHALKRIQDMTEQLGALPPGGAKGGFDMRRLEWLDLRNMLLVARAVAQAALARRETRGAQVHEDFPQASPAWAVNQFVTLRGGKLEIARAPAPAETADS